MDRVHPAYLVAAAGGAAVAALALHSWLGSTRRTWRAKRRARRAIRGELAAEQLLQQLGYRIHDRQMTTIWTVATDAGSIDVELRADLIVTKDGRTLVAEVKTGELAPSLANAATRRQLLEYRLAFDVDGILLVDVEAHDVCEVEFPIPLGSVPRPRIAWRLTLAAAAAGIAAGAAAALVLAG